jgi:hypothetical protein
MEEHDEAPAWLLLPFDTNKEILPLAAEIYDVPTKREDVVKPTFVAELPKITHEPIFTLPGRLSERDPSEQSITERWGSNPLLPSASEQMRRQILIDKAKAGTLTTVEIQRMTMEEYQLVRGYLLPQVREAIKGKTAGEVLGTFKKLGYPTKTKFTDITES